MREFKFEGPRPACRALKTMMDDIGDPLVEAIDRFDIKMTPEDREKLKKNMEKVLVDVFASKKVDDLCAHIYALHERIES